MLRTLALLLSICAPADEDWTALPLPALCARPPAAAHPAALWQGSHLRLAAAPEGAESDREGAVARLPIALVVQMLEEDARARGTRIEIARSTPLLLARGDAAAITAARALIADLDRAAEAFEIDLEVALVPTAAGGAASDAPRAGGGTVAKKRVRGGEEAFFGVRAAQSFVAGFEVEVAADSGVAEPIVGRAATGATVHLRALRVDGGRKVHVHGILDVAELAALESFSPETSDLGVVQQPRVACAQAVFAGVVDSGGALEVVLAGTGLARPDWTLRIQATTRPDPEPAEGETAGWSALDLGFLAFDPEPLAALRPGAGLDLDQRSAEPAGAGLGLSASAVAAALDASRAGDGAQRGARTSVFRASDLVFVPRGEPRLVREARALVRGSEALRTRSGRLEIRRGALRVVLPVCEGFPARLAVGAEQARLVDYRVELAPQTWMPVPEVATVFDGLALEAWSYAGFADCSFWLAASGPGAIAGRDQAQLGRLQLLARTLQAEATRLVANQPERLVLEVPIVPGSEAAKADLHLRLQMP